ncbi:MAG: Gfo/Idh/MocA family oxidoreductase [Rhodospirillales bacterium]|nr:Gfo/Idh/MocA family oxidoreductase [Rhodospirillales bacterium]
MSKLKTLIVGFGAVARGLAMDTKMSNWFPIATHAQALQADNRFDWVGVVDPDPAAQKSAKQDWNISAFGSVEEAAHLEPDILILAAPPGERAAVLRALTSVKGVFAEKPLGDDDGKALVKEAEQRNLPLQVNYWRRGDRTLGILASGGIRERVGDIQAATGVYGNGLANNGSHLIDMIRMLLGEPVWAQAIGDITPASGGPITGDIHVAFALGMPTGTVVSIHPLDFRHYREVALDIWGTVGRIALQQETLDIRIMPRVANRGLDDEYEIAADESVELKSTVADTLPNLYANLADAVTTRTPLLSPGKSALKTENIINLVHRSANTGNSRLMIGDA